MEEEGSTKEAVQQQVRPPRALVLQLVAVAVDSAATDSEGSRHSTWTQRR